MNLRILLSLLATVLAALLSPAAENSRDYGFENGLSSTIVGGAVQDADGLLWFATWAGLHCYDGYTFHRISIEPGDSAAIGSDRILDIMLSPEDNILCHTDGDVCEFDLHDFRFKELPAHTRDSLLAEMGKAWAGLTDRQGNRWTADNKRLYKLGPMHHPASVVPGTAGLHPRSFLYHDGRMIIGTRSDRSLLTLEPDGSVADRESLPGAPYVLLRTGSGDIWAGCKPGALIKLGGDTVSHDVVYDIKEDAQGRLWVATFGNGIRCVPDPQSPHPAISAPMADGRIRQLLITPSGNIVAATTDGLLVGTIDPDDYSKTTFRRIRRDGSRPSGLGSNATMCVAHDSGGNIYIATESSGIDVTSEDELMGPDPQFRHLNTRTSALTGDVVKAMTLQSDTLLMIVGNDNITAYNPIKDTAINLSRTFWNDTCRFGEASPLMLPDGSWLFGAEEGAFRATSHNIYTRGYVPPLVFTTLAVNGADDRFCLVPEHEISLDKDSRNVTIGFAAIDYVDNANILYRSSIDGSPWSAPSPSRNITLFNMSPGRHELTVQSTDRYGRTVDNSRTLIINVGYRWHETLWARAIFVLLLVGFVTAVVYTCFHISALHRRQRELLAKYMALIGERASATGSDTPARDASRPEDTAFLNRVRKYIEDNISNPDANVDDMALAAAASRSTLNRRLRSQLGVSASQLLTRARIKRAHELMASGQDLSMADIATMCGYTDVYYFQRVLKKFSD